MLSIDFGSKKICIIEGGYSNGKVTVTECMEAEYEGEYVINGVISDRGALSLLINQLLKTRNIKSKAAVVTINSSDIIAREFKLPDVKLQNLKLIVTNEISRIIGDNSGFVIDFVVKGKSEDNMLIVMAYAVPKEIVEGYYLLLKELNIKAYALDVQSNSISKLLANAQINDRTPENGNIIAADIGYSKISFHVFSEGKCKFNRTDVSPVQEFVREIGSINRLDAKEEHIASLNFSPDYEQENPVVYDTCKYFIYRLSEELQRYIQYVLMNSEAKEVSRVYICGGISSAQGIDEALANSLKIPVEVIKKVERLNAPGMNINKICNAAGALIRL